jgi:mannosyl-oligosaccharide alpha-1,2-mannosidase
MVSHLITVLAPMVLQIAVVAASSGLNNGATGTQSVSAATEMAAPLHPGPSPSVVSGPHPSFTFPPAGASPSPICNKVQYAFPSGTNSNTSRADAVRDLYELSWNQYANYCFGHDQLLTLTNTCADDIFGWGATIVDGIDTAIVMNLTDIVTTQLAFIAGIDFKYGQSPPYDLICVIQS